MLFDINDNSYILLFKITFLKMEQNFYKMAFSSLKGLYDLKLITE